MKKYGKIMRKNIYLPVASCAVLMSGCASIDFNSNSDKGLTYYEPIPYLFVSTTDKCVSSATVITVPGNKKVMKFSSGYGSSELSAGLTNGMITAVGQKNDSKIPETVTSIAALATATLVGPAACEPSAILYPFNEGVPDSANPINFAVNQP